MPPGHAHLPLDVWGHVARFLGPADKKALSDVSQGMRAHSAAWWDGTDQVSIKFKGQGAAGQNEYDFLFETLCARMPGIRRLVVHVETELDKLDESAIGHAMAAAFLGVEEDDKKSLSEIQQEAAVSLRVLSQYAGLEALAVIGIPFKVHNDALNPPVADYAVPPTLRSLIFDTTECIALKRAIATGACSGLTELVLRNYDAVQPIMSYVDLQLGGLTSLQSLVLDHVEMHHFGEYDFDVDRIVRTTLPTSLTRMWLTRQPREYVQFNIDPDPQHHHPDYPFLNMAAMTGLRDVRLDAFTLHTGGGGLGTLACFSGLRSLHVRGLALEGAQAAAAPLYLDPSTMPQLARLHVVGDCAVDLRRLPESLLELHVELSCHLARSPFRGPVLSLDGRQRGDLVGPLVPRQSFIRAFAFDGIGFDSCPHLSRLVFVGGQVDTLLLEDLFPRLAGLRDSLRELFFAECGMCEPDSPFESAPGAAADATDAITILYPCTYVPEPVFMEGAIYGTFLNQLHIQLPGCKIAAVSSKPTIYREIVVFE